MALVVLHFLPISTHLHLFGRSFFDFFIRFQTIRIILFFINVQLSQQVVFNVDQLNNCHMIRTYFVGQLVKQVVFQLLKRNFPLKRVNDGFVWVIVQSVSILDDPIQVLGKVLDACVLQLFHDKVIRRYQNLQDVVRFQYLLQSFGVLFLTLMQIDASFGVIIQYLEYSGVALDLNVDGVELICIF